MSAAGFAYRVAPYFDDIVSDRMVNPLNRVVAAAFGYHLPPSVSDIAVAEMPRSEAFDSALSGGMSGGGCGDRAFSYAYGFDESREYFAQLTTELATIENASLVFDGTETSRELIRRWSECMKGSGYNYLSRQAAQLEFSDDPNIGDEELRVRRADLECDVTVGLTITRSAFEQQRLREELQTRSAAIAELEPAGDQLLRMLADRLEALKAGGADALPGAGSEG